MAETVKKKKYTYGNRVIATVNPGMKEKVKARAETTGDSESRIVAAALDLYFNNGVLSRSSKNTY